MLQRGECFARNALARNQRLPGDLAGACAVGARAVAAEHQLALMPLQEVGCKLGIACQRVSARVGGQISVKVRKVRQKPVRNSAPFDRAVRAGDLGRGIRADIRPEGIGMSDEGCSRIGFQDRSEALDRNARSGISTLFVDDRLLQFDEHLFHRMQMLKITEAYVYSVDGTGTVSLNVPGVGGTVDHLGSSVPGWLGRFLRDPDQADVLKKLQQSGAQTCHAFVITELYGTPWSVESYLSQQIIDHVPPEPPDLPSPVTAAWLVPTLGGNGLYWDGKRWSIIDARDKQVGNDYGYAR